MDGLIWTVRATGHQDVCQHLSCADAIHSSTACVDMLISVRNTLPWWVYLQYTKWPFATNCCCLNAIYNKYPAYIKQKVFNVTLMSLLFLQLCASGNTVHFRWLCIASSLRHISISECKKQYFYLYCVLDQINTRRTPEFSTEWVMFLWWECAFLWRRSAHSSSSFCCSFCLCLPLGSHIFTSIKAKPSNSISTMGKVRIILNFTTLCTDTWYWYNCSLWISLSHITNL